MPDTTIDFLAVLDALDLERPDRTGKVNCPFHDDRTASLHVYPDMHWHCYGCGAQGDAINFVTRYMGCSYGQALRFIARQIDVDAEDIPAALKRAAEPTRTIEYVDLTDRFMDESVTLGLIGPGELGQRQRSWRYDAAEFAARRWKIDIHTLHAFGVRAAANALWIPHWHPDGRIVGVKVRNTSTGDKVSMKGSRFGAQLYRSLPLWGIASPRAFVVEGEPDCWKAWAHFHKEANSTTAVYGLPGGASTLRQEWADELVAKHTHITLCFDNDAAGESARARFSEMFTSAYRGTFKTGWRDETYKTITHVRPEGGKDFTESYNNGWRPA